MGRRRVTRQRTQTNEMTEVVPGLRDVLEENGLLGALLEGRGGGLVLTIWKRPADEQQFHMGKAPSVLRKAPRPACMSPALEGGSGLFAWLHGSEGRRPFWGGMEFETVWGAGTRHIPGC